MKLSVLLVAVSLAILAILAVGIALGPAGGPAGIVAGVFMLLAIYHELIRRRWLA